VRRVTDRTHRRRIIWDRKAGVESRLVSRRRRRLEKSPRLRER
jgi:hypothetical protein